MIASIRRPPRSSFGPRDRRSCRLRSATSSPMRAELPSLYEDGGGLRTSLKKATAEAQLQQQVSDELEARLLDLQQERIRSSTR